MVFVSPDDEEFKKKKGTRLEVFHGIAYICGRGKKVYTRSDLDVDEKTGKIVIIRKQEPLVGKYMPSKSAISEDEPWVAFNKKYGSRELVFNGLSYCTKSGLKKTDLMLNAKGRIVSRKKSELAKLRFLKKKIKEDDEVKVKIAKTILKDPVSHYIPKKNLSFAKRIEEAKEFEKDEPPSYVSRGNSPAPKDADSSDEVTETLDDIEFADEPLESQPLQFDLDSYEDQFTNLQDKGYIEPAATYQEYRAPRVYSRRNFWRR